MKIEQIIEEISRKDFDVPKWGKMAVDDYRIREILIQQLISNENIMVYYHCYYILDLATATAPKEFYPYWDEIAKLLYHKNSYHHNISMSLIANMIEIDNERKFNSLFDQFILLIDDKKITTSICALRCFKANNTVQRRSDYSGDGDSIKNR